MQHWNWITHMWTHCCRQGRRWHATTTILVKRCKTPQLFQNFIKWCSLISLFTLKLKHIPNKHLKLKCILNLWLKVATYGGYNSWTHSWHSFCNGNQVFFRRFFLQCKSNILHNVLPNLVAEVPITVHHLLVCFHSPVQFIPNQLDGV